jgi:hypothetical protein
VVKKSPVFPWLSCVGSKLVATTIPRFVARSRISSFGFPLRFGKQGVGSWGKVARTVPVSFRPGGRDGRVYKKGSD